MLKIVAPKAAQLGVQLVTHYVGLKIISTTEEKDEINQEIDAEIESLDIKQMLEKWDTADEQKKIDRMLLQAEQLYKNGKVEKGKEVLQEVLTVTQCSRCKSGLEKIIADDTKAANKITILRGLVPSYMTILQEEKKLASPEAVVKTDKPCLPCIAETISKVCAGDPDCVTFATRVQMEDPTAGTEVIVRKITQFARDKDRKIP